MALQQNLDGTDWQDDKDLEECMMHMLTEEVMCDVTFRVGSDKTPIKAHTYMLASRSPVFYTICFYMYSVCYNGKKCKIANFANYTN